MFLFLLLVIWTCQLNFAVTKARSNASLTGNIKNRWYGPSYRPSWWNPDDVTGLRSSDFGYEGSNAFKHGASEGSLIGLSIGIVIGSIRAISLDGLPHSEDETPVKTLLSHIVGGLISGALVGIVYTFFKECVFN